MFGRSYRALPPFYQYYYRAAFHHRHPHFANPFYRYHYRRRMGIVKLALIGGAGYWAYNRINKNKNGVPNHHGCQRQHQQQQYPQQPYSQYNGSQRDMSEYDQRIPEQYFNIQPKSDQKQLPPQYQHQQSYAQYPNEKSMAHYSK